MSRRKRYSAEFKRETLKRANEEGVTDVLVAEDQITFPVSRYGTVLNLGRTFPDRYRVLDAAMRGRLLRVTAPATHRPRMPQVLQQLFLQGSAGLDEQRSVDRLV